MNNLRVLKRTLTTKGDTSHYCVCKRELLTDNAYIVPVDEQCLVIPQVICT